MARNASGTYTLPLADVVGNTTIFASWANTSLNDLEAEMTDSLSRSGKGGMLAPLPLIDGSTGAPSLAFTSAMTTGLFRTTATGALNLVVAGANRLALTPAGTSSYLDALAGGAGGASHAFNTAATRTAGSLFSISNAGTVRFDVQFSGQIAVVGGQAAGGTGTDFDINTTNTRTAGLLFAVRNAGSNMLTVDTSGTLTTTGSVTVGTGLISASGGLSFYSSGFVVRSQLAAGSTGLDFSVDPSTTRTAGSLFRVSNNTVTGLDLTYDRRFSHISGQLAGGTGTDFAINTTNTRTAGKLFDVQNASASKFSVDTSGNVVVAGSVTAAGYSIPGIPTRYVLSADVSCSSNTVATNVGTAISAVSGKTYMVRGTFWVRAAAATTGAAVTIKATGAPTITDGGLEFFGPTADTNPVTAFAGQRTNVFSDTPTALTGSSTGLPGHVCTFTAKFTTTSTGTIQIILLSEVNASQVTIAAGSWFEVTTN